MSKNSKNAPSGNDKDNITYILDFYRHVESHAGEFEFAFAIGIFQVAGHYGTGGHTGVVLSTKTNHGYVRGLKVDFTDSGILVSPYDWTKHAAKWTEQKDPRRDSYALWYNSISRQQMICALAEAAYQDRNPHRYNMLGFLPGKTLGQNCATFAVKLARYAGFNFELERIIGTNALLLHNVLKLRQPLTNWKVKYRIKGS
ncbi:MAG TPA: hypothetical protein VLH58_02315 [Candidatus Methylomirabilis sp.]|nr:hypothetical protein [Candidatus Methylomirabilis sp.]HSC70157.1 hypothetical protein [Candidatus Methylomirabilis sp.]